MNIDVTDEDLANRATSADDYFNKLARTVGGADPITPAIALMYGTRLVLICNNKAYISDPNDFEYITEARHVVMLPGKKPITAAGVLGSMLYFFGPTYCYASSGNEGDPRTWPEPDQISASIGVPGPNAVEFRSTREISWVASRTGLWRFNGQFPEQPITWLWRSYWSQINWTYGHTLVVREDQIRQRVYVAAPMGSATTPSHLWVIDYSRGTDPTQVDITIDSFEQSSYSPSSLCMVEESSSARGMWMAPAAGGDIWKQAPGYYRDGASAPIISSYETGFLLDFYNSIPSQMEWINVDVSGSGFLSCSFYSRDRTVFRSLSTIPLLASPGRLMSRMIQVVGSNGTIKFATSAVDAHFDLRSVSIESRQFATSQGW
jgi:hypothetical protein